jgi:hypothetical protein
MNSLSSQELYDICESKKLLLNGIYLKDDLPSVLKKGFYIINLQSKKTNGNGTHWCVFYYDKRKSIYLDPIGFIAPESVEKRIKPYIYCDKQIQSIDTSSCGFYCIAFIIFLTKISDKINGFEVFIKLFSTNVGVNEYILNDILNKY